MAKKFTRGHTICNAARNTSTSPKINEFGTAPLSDGDAHTLDLPLVRLELYVSPFSRSSTLSSSHGKAAHIMFLPSSVKRERRKERQESIPHSSSSSLVQGQNTRLPSSIKQHVKRPESPRCGGRD
eukprot:scaffold6506_cov171-Amphora_coffeaeformis.AAC.28